MKFNWGKLTAVLVLGTAFYLVSKTQPGGPILVNSLGIKFKRVSTSTFLATELLKNGEVLEREIKISRDFYFSVTEITNSQWTLLSNMRVTKLRNKLRRLKIV